MLNVRPKVDMQNLYVLLCTSLCVYVFCKGMYFQLPAGKVNYACMVQYNALTVL